MIRLRNVNNFVLVFFLEKFFFSKKKFIQGNFFFAWKKFFLKKNLSKGTFFLLQSVARTHIPDI